MLEHKAAPRSDGSIVAPEYASGDYFADTRRHSGDARFKTDSFLRIFRRFAEEHGFEPRTFVDVGCGSGDVVGLVTDALRARHPAARFVGFDVSPHVRQLRREGVEYVHGDFCASDEVADVVTLFDVFEHIPDPVGFLRSVARKCRVMALHIPLDDSLNVAVRGLHRAKLRDPGHLVFLDTAAALNLLALSGLRVVDYEYTFVFLAPSGRGSVAARLVFPLRAFLARVSPWLLSKTLGGASLMVVAITPEGLPPR